MKNIAVIIAAAGSGTRMLSKEKKQFIKLDKKEILVRTIEKFQYIEEINKIVVVTNEEEVSRCEELIKKNRLTKVTTIVKGGTRRQDSIYNALKVLSKNTDIVLVHDAARPFVTKEIILNNIKEVEETGGVITAVYSKDTIKVVENGYVKETLDRNTLINVQTPQTFEYNKLISGYKYMKEKNISVTDDSSLAELIGIKVKIVLGTYDNIKITTPEDLLIGELILKKEK